MIRAVAFDVGETLISDDRGCGAWADWLGFTPAVCITGGETVYQRHRRWSADGTWERLLSLVQAAEDAEGRIDWDVSVDSTTVRAHQHAAGARKVPPAAVPQKGAGQGTNRVEPVLRKLVVRLEEVIRSANAWDAPAAASPPKSTSPPRDDAGPSGSF
ncbi:hypothetical protein HOK021_35660 [Streptomyces hygroscopicus]|nr:hypothetical protein HOK021_35660 [Streptomyces hygroscopicus]